jgi:hypothetical protein
MTFAFPLLAMGQTAVACAIYADMIAALKEKRPLASHQSLGYTAEAQPLAAQPPSAYSQHQVRINLKNAVVSLTMNSVRSAWCRLIPISPWSRPSSAGSPTAPTPWVFRRGR